MTDNVMKLKQRVNFPGFHPSFESVASIGGTRTQFTSGSDFQLRDGSVPSAIIGLFVFILKELISSLDEASFVGCVG